MDLFNQPVQFNLQRPLIFIDLETTGTDANNDKIIEIAMVKINSNNTRQVYRSFVNPNRPIPASSTAIHGITDEMVKNEPLFNAIATAVKEFLADGDLAGFNSNRFDIPLLIEEMLRANIDIEIENRKCVDVQRIYHKNEPRNLAAAYQFYCNKPLENAHSALADVEATADILLAQIAKYDNLINDVSALEKFSADGDFVDVARRFYRKDNAIYFNFGKYKDHLVVSVLQKEPQYYNWMMNNDFPLHTKLKLKHIKENM
jgi:DNA polymerase-3 subunit epsilon